MDVTAKSAAADVAVLQPVLGDARRYSFFQLVDLIHRHHNDDMESAVRNSGSLAPERIRFTASAGLGFPGSDVVSALSPVHEHAPYQLEVSFLGLHGAQSPLPGYYLEDLAWEAVQNLGVRRHFLDFFNHRLVTLFHRSWRKYRYYVRYRPGANDGFSDTVFALIGLGDRKRREALGMSESRMLAYAGLLAAPGRSAQVVERIVGHCFDLADVHIRQWVLRNVDIAPAQQTALGQANARLGHDTLAGSKVADHSGKFCLRIGNLCHQRFTGFLPNGDDYSRLIRLLEFVVREPLAWDLELHMLPQDIQPVALGRYGRLGWTTFSSPPNANANAHVSLPIRH